MARRLSLGWLKPPKVPEDGVMSLADHLRELRYRLIVSMIAILLGMILCLFFYEQLLTLLLQPYNSAVEQLKISNPRLDVQAVLNDLLAPFMLMLKVSALGGLILSSPVWIYQAWAYIVPALLAKEKRYALTFVAAAVPLFLLGVVIAYWVLPQGIVVMMGFTPEGADITNLFELNNFLNFLVQMMLVFGLGFLMPVFVVGANLMGLVTAEQLKKARVYVVFGSFVFGAAATPGGDPFSMIALAIPMSLLFLGAELICRGNDKRRAKRLGTDVVAT